METAYSYKFIFVEKSEKNEEQVTLSKIRNYAAFFSVLVFLCGLRIMEGADAAKGRSFSLKVYIETVSSLGNN